MEQQILKAAIIELEEMLADPSGPPKNSQAISVQLEDLKARLASLTAPPERS